jgi:chloramphenicol-sensitive protein RarD
MQSSRQVNKRGILYGVASYALWGFFPIYWKLLHDVSALQLLGHRVGWSFLLLLCVILVRGQWDEFRSALNGRTMSIYLAASLLIGVNWLIYVWAVNADFIIETSLGYFINPLLSMLLGVIFLRERLRLAQWIPVAVATIGVACLTYAYGRPPWIALALALTFGFYGLVKKLAPLGSLHGLTLETGILFPPAILYLGYLQIDGSAAFLHLGTDLDLLMIGGGIVTAIPLLLFASAARLIPLTTIGILQYLAPSIQFLIGVMVYDEPFDQPRLIGFSIVWLALIIFWVENYFASRTPLHPLPELGKG